MKRLKYLTLEECSALPVGALLVLRPLKKSRRVKLLFNVESNDGKNFTIGNANPPTPMPPVRWGMPGLGDEWEGFLQHWKIARLA